jgi:TolB-like protein/DNA-binding winged helix-turn-helix (wHTH) protein/Tfp pilus assembly protein PilF
LVTVAETLLEEEMATATDKWPNPPEAFTVADSTVDPLALQVTVDGEPVRIEAKVMQVLLYLAEHAGRVISRAELEEKLWPGRIVTEDSVTKAIAKLRRVFRDDAHHPRVIETIPKSGYRLIADVRRTDTADSARPKGPGSTSGASSGRLMRIRQWMAGGVLTGLLLLGLSWMLLRLESGLSPQSPPITRPAVAVIPFDNLGRMPDDDYFADGITADLITDLSKLKDLLVIAPGTTFAYRDLEATPDQIASELDVDYLVIGSVQRLRQALRINVNLFDARSGGALWGERYIGKPDQIFPIQDRITVEVVAALKLELAPAEQLLLTGRPTKSIAAYDAYLRGFEAHGRRSEAQNSQARRHFEEAVALDPEFARAHAGLALTYSREAIDGWTTQPSRSLSLAAQHAETAAALDSSLPQVHFVTGQVRLFQRSHSEAVAAAERAIDADPNYADAFALLAWTLNYAGRPSKAMSSLNTAMRLNPRPPASYLEILGEIYFSQGRYAESASTFQQVLDINPAYLRARLWNAAALVRAGAIDQAGWEVQEALVASPDLTTARLAFAFPFKDPRTEELALQALRGAGLQDPP